MTQEISEEEQESAAPVLQGRIDGDCVMVWCQHCNREHSHGRHDPKHRLCKHSHSAEQPCVCPIGSGDGHRTAHCHDPNSPYADTGYTIKESANLSKPKPKRIKNSQTGSHVLYRFYDHHQNLLYIGITANPPHRFKSHQSEKEWWDTVSVIRLETFSSRELLEIAEKVAIKNEKPLHNQVHNKNSADMAPSFRPKGWGKLSGLVAKFFHTTRTCNCGSRVACWQGRIIDEPAPYILLIELFSWLDGEPCGQELISVRDFMDKSPVLYDSAKDMRFSVDFGVLHHARWAACEQDGVGVLVPIDGSVKTQEVDERRLISGNIQTPSV